MNTQPAPTPPQPCTDSPAGRVLCDPAGAARGWMEHALVWLGTYGPVLSAVAVLAGAAVAVGLTARAQRRWTITGRGHLVRDHPAALAVLRLSS